MPWRALSKACLDDSFIAAGAIIDWPGREGMHRSILIVDDESRVRKLVRSILASDGYQSIMEAEDGIAALELIQKLKAGLRLVITDIQMPRMNGAELTRQLRAEYPNTKILCMSGYTDPLSPNG